MKNMLQGKMSMIAAVLLLTPALLAGCGKKTETTLFVAAAASLENCMDRELIPLFEKQNPGILVEGVYDSSGRLQIQIENGLEADVFISAAQKQMNALSEEGMVEEASIVPLLENKLVLIVPAGREAGYEKFADIEKAENPAIGDPESVPAGQYAKEALESLGIWEEVSSKASLGTNVTEVQSWVAAGSADAGLVYATDAALGGQVTVIAEAPEGSLSQPVIYPAGMIGGSSDREAAELFLTFLQTREAMEIFEAYGFTPAVMEDR